MTRAPYTGPALFHLGYPKTASTFLQSRVFSAAIMGYGLAGGDNNRAFLVSWFKTDDPYIQDVADVRTTMALAEAPLRDEGLMPVWSEETLLGNPLHRTYDGPWILDRLKQVAPQAKILITIRNQNAFALSAYREHLKLGQHPLQDFIGTGQEPRSYHPILKEDYLKFDRTVAAYQMAFGTSQVCVLPQEMLHHDATKYFAHLGRFTERGTKDTPSMDRLNVGLGATALCAARILNGAFVRSPLSNRATLSERIARRLVRGVDRISPATLNQKLERRWADQIDARYAGRFGASNTQLAELTGLNLGALGYAIADPNS